jgi:hypothetical protein
MHQPRPKRLLGMHHNKNAGTLQGGRGSPSTRQVSSTVPDPHKLLTGLPSSAVFKRPSILSSPWILGRLGVCEEESIR